MWTIFNSAGEAVSNCDREPNPEDLAVRSERAVFHEEEFALDEIMLAGGEVKRKPLVSLTAVVETMATTISVGCDDPAVGEILLIVGESRIVKPPGKWVLKGEPGVCVIVDVDRRLFRGNRLEVKFDV